MMAPRSSLDRLGVYWLDRLGLTVAQFAEDLAVYVAAYGGDAPTAEAIGCTPSQVFDARQSLRVAPAIVAALYDDAGNWRALDRRGRPIPRGGASYAPEVLDKLPPAPRESYQKIKVKQRRAINGQLSRGF